jgi:integrase
MRCILNDKKIQSIKSSHKRQEYWDLSLPGFGIRVAKSGQKTFFVMCRENGKQKRVTLDKYPIISLSEARNLAREKLRLISQGLPLEEKKRAVITVEQAFNCFIEIYAKKKNKDWKRTEQRLQLSIVKEYGPVDIREVTRQHIIALLDKIVARDAPIQANRVLAGVSKFFNWCAERGYIENSPVKHISKPANENPRDRVLSDDEIELVWKQTEKMGYPYGQLFQILMLTGQRKSEVGDMCWSEIDFKEKVWMIPKERAKNGHSHAVPLSNQVLTILDTIPRFLHSNYVFTTTGKGPVSGFGKV